MRRFEKHMGRSEIGSERCVVYVNERDRSVEILLYSRPAGKTIGWTQDGRLDDVKDGEELKPFFTFTQELYEDFPNIIVVLYKALQDFFGDSLDRIPASEKHLADMRRIVEKKLGVTFND